VMACKPRPECRRCPKVGQLHALGQKRGGFTSSTC
jgi:hypothetical protein